MRNAYQARISTVHMPYSQMKHDIALVMKSYGFLEKVGVHEDEGRKVLDLNLMSNTGGKMPILKRVSKPGQRIYIKSGDIRPVVQGYGISIISTSLGVMAGKDAKEKNVGGELLCIMY